MRVIPYDREKAVAYAHKWAYGRNPKYYDYSEVGGDCTNFVSQCIYEGSGIMNYRPIYGWYYISGNNKSPSWTGVEYLYNFLINNQQIGPFGRIVRPEQALIGDIAQLSFDGINYTHSPFIVETKNTADLSKIKIAAHTYDADYKPISEYSYVKIRFIHIEGVRVN